MPKHIYAPGQGLEETESKVYALVGEARGKGGGMLDSASAESMDVIKQSVAKPADLLPSRMAKLLDKIEGDKNKGWAVSCLLDGIQRFQSANGFMPSADLIDAVISQAENIADGSSGYVLPQGATLDSISSNNASTSLSHQPNRIAVAITGGFSEACPFGAYLPADLKSNECKLAILSAVAGSNFGAYKEGSLLDGTSGGLAYTRSERIVDVTVSEDRLGGSFKVTTQIDGVGAQVPLLRNRTAILVDGFTVAMEQASDSGTPSSLISGQFKIGQQNYVISGTVNVDTGVGALTFAPLLPAGVVVEAQAFINFEKKPDLIPAINTTARSFSLYCSPSRVLMQVTPDSRTSTQSELGADGLTIAVQAARTQAANERYIDALRKAKRMAKRTKRVFNYDAERQLVEKTRSMIWRDFGSFVGTVDQEVANQTMEYGLSFMYVGAIGASQFQSMDSTDFVSSGISARPGIYRIGKYKGKYDVFYDPYVVEETETDIEILCIGRSPQVARNPIVFSDAVPQTLIPLAVGSDLKSGAALFSRGLTEVNPHLPSAVGCALIIVENVYALAG